MSREMMSLYWTIDLSAAMGQLLMMRPVGQGRIPAPSESVVKLRASYRGSWGLTAQVLSG
jgi:hypothetical protein